MSLRNHVWAVRVLAVGTLAWIVAQVGLGLWLGEWRYALAEAIGGLSWLALVVILPLRTSNALACPACGYSYGPRILGKMTCPHCGASVPDDVHTGWSMVAALVLVAVVGVGTAVYTWPMALPSLPQEEVSVTVLREADPIVEDFVAIPQMDGERYVLTPGSPEAEEVAEIMSGYIYRRCWKTLRGDTAVSGLGEVHCYFYGPDFDVSLLGNRYAWINGAVYQIGLVGDGAGAELTARVAQALE